MPIWVKMGGTIALTAHIVSSIGWMGPAFAYLVMALAALSSHDSQTVAKLDLPDDGGQAKILIGNGEEGAKMKIGYSLLCLFALCFLSCQKPTDESEKPLVPGTKFKYVERENRIVLEKWEPVFSFLEIQSVSYPDTVIFVPGSGRIVFRTSRNKTGEAHFYMKRIYCDADPAVLCLDILFSGFSNEESNRQWHFTFQIKDEIETLYSMGFNRVDTIDSAKHVLEPSH